MPNKRDCLTILMVFLWVGCGGDDPLVGPGGECEGEDCIPNMLLPEDTSSSTDEGISQPDVEEEEELPPPPTDCALNTDCDDLNGCTSGACFQGKCVYTNISDPCDDEDPCTSNDVCSEGKCAGQLMDCDPGQICQVGVCKEGECVYNASPDDVCALQLDVTGPDRGASIQAISPVMLTGSITSPASPDVTLTLNGKPLGFENDGSFSHEILPHLGVNIIELVLVDSFEREARAARAFLFATDYADPGSLSSPNSIPGCCGVWLSDEAFDDDDTADLDDVATAIHLLVSTFDINSVIPKPIENKVATCTYKITVSNVSYDMGFVDLDPAFGSIELNAQLNNLKGDIFIDASGWCGGDQEGTFEAQILIIDATIEASVDQFQDFEVDLESIEVELVGANANFDSGALSYLNWATDWFEDDLAGYLVDKVEDWMLDNVSPMITEVLNDVADYELIFEAPAIEADGAPLPLGLNVDPSGLELSPAGAEIAMEIGVGATKNTAHTAPGSVLRGFCPHSNSSKPVFPKTSLVEGYLNEDIINQAFFMLWWGGLTKFSVGPDVIGQYVSGFDLSDLYVDVDPWLPPVVTSCNPDGELEAQLGDIHVKSTFGFLDQTATLEFFASARGSASFQVVDVADAPNYIALQLDDVDQLAIEVISIDGLDPIKKSLLTLMLSDAVVELFINQFLADVAGSYPIPNIDLSPWIDSSIHEKPILRLEMETLQLTAGYVLLGGKVLNY